MFPLHSPRFSVLLQLFKSKCFLSCSGIRFSAFTCVALAVALSLETSSGWGLQVWVFQCLLENTIFEWQRIEMWLLSASKCSINTQASLKPWQRHCNKLTRLSNFPSWNKSFLMYFQRSRKKLTHSDELDFNLFDFIPSLLH